VGATFTRSTACPRGWRCEATVGATALYAVGAVRVPDGRLALLLVAPVALVAWLVSTAALRYGARRWVLALCGLERRHLVVIDAKGGHDGLAHGIVSAYLAAWPDARVRLFPQERLDIWRGSPQEVCNRLVETWDWTAESSYWRESAMTALRLALGQPGPPCRSGAELVRRLDPAALERAWEHDPEVLGLVRSMSRGRTTNWPGSTSGWGTWSPAWPAPSTAI
jgi:hypothetical protein